MTILSLVEVVVALLLLLSLLLPIACSSVVATGRCIKYIYKNICFSAYVVCINWATGSVYFLDGEPVAALRPRLQRGAL